MSIANLIFFEKVRDFLRAYIFSALSKGYRFTPVLHSTTRTRTHEGFIEPLGEAQRFFIDYRRGRAYKHPLRAEILPSAAF